MNLQQEIEKILKDWHIGAGPLSSELQKLFLSKQIESLTKILSEARETGMTGMAISNELHKLKTELEPCQ